MPKNTCTIFARDLNLMADVGIYPPEKKGKQPLRFQVSITFKRLKKGKETIDDIISYGDIVTIVKAAVNKGHTELLETLGDNILDAIFKYKIVTAADVTIEKLKPYSPVKGHMEGVTTLGVTLARKR